MRCTWRLDARRELDVIMPLPEEPHGFTSQLRAWVYPGTADPALHHNLVGAANRRGVPAEGCITTTPVRVVVCAEVAGMLSMHKYR
jgi:hypothetical protein